MQNYLNLQDNLYIPEMKKINKSGEKNSLVIKDDFLFEVFSLNSLRLFMISVLCFLDYSKQAVMGGYYNA